MTSANLATFNRRVEALYRVAHLKEPLEHVAKVVGLRGKQSVRRLLDRAERDPAVLRSVAMRCSAEERKMNEEFR